MRVLRGGNRRGVARAAGRRAQGIRRRARRVDPRACRSPRRMFGYLPEAALKKISLALDKPYSEVAGVVGFYSFFTTVPRGKHLVRVCLGTACYVRGGKEVLAGLAGRAGYRGGRDHRRPAVLARRGPLLRRLRPGAGHHDRRRRPPARQARPTGQDPRPVSQPKTADAENGDERMSRRIANPEQLDRLRDAAVAEKQAGPTQRPQADPRLHGRQLHRLRRRAGRAGAGDGDRRARPARTACRSSRPAAWAPARPARCS